MSQESDAARRQEIADRVFYWVRRRGMTRIVFADRLGKSVSWVDKIKHGDRQLDRLSVLEQIADVLSVPLGVLINREEARRSRQCVDDVEIAALKSALGRYEGISDRPAATGSGDPVALPGQLVYVRSAFQASHFTVVCRVLPPLIWSLQHAMADAREKDRRPLAVTLVQTYQLATSTLLKFDQGEVAWLAADRAIAMARETGDITALAGASRTLARALLASRQGPEAVDLLRGMINRMQPFLSERVPELLSLYGMLLLRAELAAARTSDPVVARDMHAEAARVAGWLGGDRNDHGTAFGPTNVAMHRLAALVRLSDGASALAFAETMPAVASMPRERRANYQLDLAEAHRQLGHHDQAAAALVAADRAAPEEVRCRPLGRGLVGEMLPLSNSGELRQLARRAGLPT